MNKRLALVASACLCLSAWGGGGVSSSTGAAGGKQPRAKVRLVETGEYHGGEVDARTGETWLGLYVSEGGSVLRPSVVTVELVHDAIVDQSAGIKTGKAVSVDYSERPVFLVRGADALQAGPVVTAHDGERALHGAADVGLSLSGVDYGLKVVTKDDRRLGYVALDDARLVLSAGGRQQVLYDLGGKGAETEASWNLLWAGDLDDDGKLDLYVEVSDHYNSSSRRLFLSSRARAGKLVREIAEFTITGC